MWIQESAEISFVIFFSNVLFVSISDWNKNSVRCFIDFLKKQNEKKETLCNRWEWQSGEYFVHLLGPLEILMDSQTMTLSAYGMELPFRQSVAKIPSERTAQVSGIRWTRTNNITKNNCWLSREKNFIDRDSHSRCSSTWKSEVFFSSISREKERKVIRTIFMINIFVPLNRNVSPIRMFYFHYSLLIPRDDHQWFAVSHSIFLCILMINFYVMILSWKLLDLIKQTCSPFSTLPDMCREKSDVIYQLWVDQHREYIGLVSSQSNTGQGKKKGSRWFSSTYW